MNAWLGFFEAAGGFAVEAAARVTVLAVLLCGAGALLRRQSASVRNLVWRWCVLVFLLMPLAMPLLPRINAPVFPPPIELITRETRPVSKAAAPLPEPVVSDSSSRPQAVVESSTVALEESPSITGLSIFGCVWLAGVLLMFARLGASFCRLSRLDREAKPLVGSRFIALAREVAPGAVVKLGDGAHPPLTFGWRRPVILVSMAALGWSEERWRMALAHEGAHIQRRDYLWNVAGELAVACFWFHPLAWLANRAMRVEAEHAADDLTLAAGARPVEYATELLAVASACRRQPTRLAIAMAAQGKLERRIELILAQGRKRGDVGRWRAAGFATLVLALLAGAACTQPVRRQSVGSLERHATAIKPAEEADKEAPELVLVGWHNPQRIPHAFSIWARRYSEHDAKRTLENMLSTLRIPNQQNPSLWVMFRSRLTDEDSFRGISVTDSQGQLVMSSMTNRHLFRSIIAAHKDQHPMGWTPSDDGVIFIGQDTGGPTPIPESVNITLSFAQGDWNTNQLALENSTASGQWAVNSIAETPSETMVKLKVKEPLHDLQTRVDFVLKGGQIAPPNSVTFLNGVDYVIEIGLPKSTIQGVMVRQRPQFTATYKNIPLPAQEKNASELFLNNQQMQLLAGSWAGATWGESILKLQLEPSRVFERDFGKVREAEHGSWLVERGRIKLQTPTKAYDLEIMELDAHTMTVKESDGRSLSFRRIIQPVARELSESERQFVGSWTTRRGFFLTQLKVKEDGSFESVLAGDTFPMATGSWTASDGEVRLKTLSAHNAQQIGHTLVCSYVKNDLGEESLQGQGLNRTVAFFRDAAN